MKITFLGATKTVTGSNFLVEAAGKKFLVDCGMYQGRAELELENYNPFDYNPNCSGLNTHCIIGLISAKLSKNENYDKLEKIYSKIVEDNDFNDIDKVAFDKIKKYLKN